MRCALYSHKSRTSILSGPRLTSVLAAALALTGPAALADLPAATLRAVDGRQVEILPPAGGATALVFLSTECPISNAYSPTVAAIAEEFAARPVRVVGVLVDPDKADAALARHAREYRIELPFVPDRNQRLAARYKISVTPEVVVLDDAGSVRYRGRIDDQFAARQKRNSHPQTHELRDAIAAVLGGAVVEPASVVAIGCPLPRPLPEKVTYASHVATILQKNCQECHRPGQIGPFSLLSYRDAAKRADDLAAVVEARSMPPWKAARGVGPELKHDRSLAESDIAALVAWAAAGAPEGNPADLPPPAQFSDDWALGTPDLVLEPDQDYHVRADGKDDYRCFVIPTQLLEDKAIAAIEYRPGNRRVVHHILAYVDTQGQGRKRDEQDPGPGYACFSGPGIEIHGDLGGWAPGNAPSRLPEGVGRALPRGADVVMQVHYHPSGKEETDRSRIGLYFARTPIKQTLHWSLALKADLKVPPGEKNYEARAYAWKIPVDVEALAVMPHMHLLGKDMTISVTYPDGRIEDLVRVPEWDFRWQYTYYFQRPLVLPAGTMFNVVAHYDNSASNPNNPNSPPKEVCWGEATTDEMCIGFIALTKKGQDLTRPGEKDDLQQIIERSYEEQYPKDRRKRERRRVAEDGDSRSDD
jgi:hypothetical protein